MVSKTLRKHILKVVKDPDKRLIKAIKKQLK